MRRTTTGAAVALVASLTLLSGCADDSGTDPVVDEPAVEDTMMDEMPTMEPTDG